MFYAIDNNKKNIKCFGDGYFEVDDCKTIETDKDIDISKFYAYIFDESKNELVFSEDLYKEIQNEIEIVELRNKREEECFSIINRGEAWYSIYVNTEERKKEFEKWYQDWLNVTETKIIPDKPDWIF